MTYQRSLRYLKPALSTGLLSIEGNLNTFLTTLDGVNITVGAGKGIIVQRPTLGKHILKEVTWESQTFSPPTPNGLFSINIDENGLVFLTEGNAVLPAETRKDFIDIGGVGYSGGFISNLGAGSEPAFDYEGNLTDVLQVLGPVNSLSNPFTAEPNGVEILGRFLQLKINPGTEMLFNTGMFRNPRVPNIFTRDSEVPTGIILLSRQGNATFSLSPTAEIDPNTYETKGVITNIDDGGVGFTKITSIAHGLSNGDIVDINSTVNYNGTYIVSDSKINTFEIETPFVGLETAGLWGALTAVPNSQYTVQRFIVFPLEGLIGAYYGTRTYATEDEARTNYPSLEPFKELGPSATGIHMFDIIMQEGETNLSNMLIIPFSRFRL